MEMQGLKTSFFGRQAQPLHGVKCSLLLLVIISLRIAWGIEVQDGIYPRAVFVRIEPVSE